MNVLDVLAYGTSLGLGSPQQQRDNVFRQSELDQRKMLAQSELETRKAAQEAEAKRFEMQYGNASPDELAFARPQIEEMGGNLPAGAAISKQMLQYLMQAANAMPMNEIVDPSTYLPIGQTKSRRAPMLPGIQGEYEAPNPDVAAGENPEPSGMQTRAPVDPRKALLLHPGSATQVLARRREEETERRNTEKESRAAGLAAQKDAALTQFSTDVSAGMDRIAAFDKNNLARYGLKLADMAKPDFQKEPEDPSIKTGRELRNKLLQERVDALQDAKEAGNIMDKAQRGEEIPVQVREKAVRAFERSASINSQIALTMTAEEGEPFKVEAIQNMKNAKFLREYRSRAEQQAQSAVTGDKRQIREPAETGSLRNRMPSQGSSGIKAKSDAAILRLFGPGATFQKLTPAQKQQLADALSAG